MNQEDGTCVNRIGDDLTITQVHTRMLTHIYMKRLEGLSALSLVGPMIRLTPS